MKKIRTQTLLLSIGFILLAINYVWLEIFLTWEYICILLGLSCFLIIIHFIRLGYFIDQDRSYIRRDERPIEFWTSIIISALLAIFLFGGGIFFLILKYMKLTE